MALSEKQGSSVEEIVITPRDILFECPGCGKSLVVDEAAEGMIVECPRCHIGVIVPPKPVPSPAPAAVASESGGAVVESKPPAEGEDLRGRLVTLANKLKELQTQRTEINNRLAARINDINRDLVLVARLETSHQQVLAELNQLIGQLGTHAASGSASASAAGRTRVNLRS
jgi:DNA-directed RNA polymerase subunit RPC12/RpoP